MVVSRVVVHNPEQVRRSQGFEQVEKYFLVFLFIEKLFPLTSWAPNSMLYQTSLDAIYIQT